MEEIQKEILMSATGSANQANISSESIKSVRFIKPSKNISEQFENLAERISANTFCYNAENRELEKFKNLFLSKLATIEASKPQLATA